MKKLFAIILTLTFVLSMFAGCGNTAAETASSAASEEIQEASETEEAVAQETEETAEVTEPAEPEASDMEASSEVVADETEAEQTGATLIPEVDEVAEPGSISYPLNTDEEITLWNTSPDGPTARLFTSRQEQYCLPYAEEETGVYLKYIESASTSTVEAFNLMIAGGDYADLIPAADNYTGGLTKAYSDDVIYDLTNLIAANAPDMWNVYTQMNDSTWSTMLESGMLLAFYSIDDEVYVQNGMMTREDLLEE